MRVMSEDHPANVSKDIRRISIARFLVLKSRELDVDLIILTFWVRVCMKSSLLSLVWHSVLK